MNKNGKSVSWWVLACCGVAIVVTGVLILRDYSNRVKARELYNTVNLSVFQFESKIDRDDSPEDNSLSLEDNDFSDSVDEIQSFLDNCTNSRLVEPYLYASVDFDYLLEQNEDVCGYLVLPGTVISYPVLYSGTDTYYLKHNFDKSYGYPGCLFIEGYNKRDFSDPVNVIYGHKMHDGTMFADLYRYEEEGFLDEHGYFFLYTKDATNVYQIALVSTYTSTHLLVGDDGPYPMEGLGMDIFQKLNSYNGSKPYFPPYAYNADDELLILSTCSNKINRYIVIGKKVLTISK